MARASSGLNRPCTTRVVQQTYDWQFLTCQVDDCTPQAVAEGHDTPGSDLPAYSDLYGYLVVYANQSQIIALDLAHNTRTVLASGPGSFGSATTDGRYVYWSHNQLGDPNARCACSDLWGYDLKTGSRFAVITDNGVNLMPYARGGVLVWSHGTGAPEIHATPVNATLPTVSQPNPGTTSNDWFYFSETQHYLSFGFKDFWVQSGGVPVFGFPLTEEFSELNPDTSQMLTVQYLERQRFEYHPEHAGTPYEVELGRLGIEDARRRGLMGTGSEAFLPSTDHINGCDFAGATQHNLCGDFLAYWHSHGLNFGDAGYSDRESLALFGYPISEAYVDSANRTDDPVLRAGRLRIPPGESGSVQSAPATARRGAVVGKGMVVDVRSHVTWAMTSVARTDGRMGASGLGLTTLIQPPQ